ncbi:MAG: sialidase family protein [Candidatus Neomarinimicrobiota bacterium]|nr:sialidase family protein [Candidatus Neomarinimicrobiota bacterium]
MAATKEGTLLKSWLTPTGSEGSYSLRFAEWSKGNWSEPVAVFSGPDFFVNWADYPSVFQVNKDTLITHWLYKSGPGTFEYDVYLSVSNDRGASWSKPVIPHRDGIAAEHGFISFFRQAGKLGMAWVDGRNMAPSKHGHGSGNMSLFATTLGSDMILGPEASLDSRICECCPTAAASVGSTHVVAYRDRSDKEVRNIQIVRFDGQRWSSPTSVHDDGWMIPGCPVNGPELAVNGEMLGIAWYTAPNGEARVNVAFSYDAGATFTEPVRIDDGIPLGRVDLEWVDKNRLVASWIELVGDSAEVRIRTVSVDGKLDEPKIITAIDPGRGSGYPQMVKVGKELFFAWTVPGDWKIKMATVPLVPLL